MFGDRRIFSFETTVLMFVGVATSTLAQDAPRSTREWLISPVLLAPVPEYPVSDAERARLSTLLTTIREDIGIDALSIDIASPGGRVFSWNSGEFMADITPIGELTTSLVGVVAARLHARDGVDVNAPAHEFSDSFRPVADRFGTSPSIAQMLSGTSGARPIGLSAFDRPLFEAEVPSVFAEAPLSSLTPSFGGTAAAMTAMQGVTGKPFPALLAAELTSAGSPPVNAPPFGPIRTSPSTLASIFGSLAGGTLVPRAGLEELIARRLGTLDGAMGFRATRIESRRAWALDAPAPNAGLFVRIDFERRHATVVRLPAELPEETFRAAVTRALAAVEAVFPSPREDRGYAYRFDPRERARAIFAERDTNRDGLVAFDEANLQPNEGAAVGDLNGDLMLTIDEYATTLGSRLYLEEPPAGR